MKKLRILILAFVGLSSFEAFAAQKTIRLVCEYTHVINEKGGVEGSSGKELFTVNYLDNGAAVIERQGLGAKYTGSVNEEEIHGTTKYKLGNLTMHDKFTINRYTGSIERIHKSTGAKSALVFYGECEVVKSKRF